MLRFYFSLFLCLIISSKAIAVDDADFYEEFLISTDVKLEENAVKAKNKASDLLNQKSKPITLDNAENLPQKINHTQRENSYNRANHSLTIDNTDNKYGEGPFGLPWGASYNQIQNLGVELTKTPIKDYPNSFIARKLPNPIPDIAKVYITLGDDNLLWRIIAYGVPTEDTSDASKVMQLYRKYCNLMNKKYGNEKQYYTPKISIIEKKTVNEKGEEQIETEKYEEPIGNKNFLSQLKSGEAVLYSTFENQKVGAVVSVNVNGEGKSYIIIDFTNLQILKEQEDKTLNAL